MAPQVNLVLFVMFAACLVQGEAQQCYQCISLSSDVGDQPLIYPGVQSCPAGAADGFGEVVECTTGGCETDNLTLQFNSTQFGVFSVNLEARACGLNDNGCFTSDVIDAVLEIQRENLTSVLTTAYPDAGVSFTSGGGDACVCTGDLCNSGARVRAPILCSLILALVSVVFARLA